MQQCPCGSSQSFDQCCEPYIIGQSLAPTAESLMRSRYTAHVIGNYDYLHKTVHPDMQDDSDYEEMRQWSESVEWLGLDVLNLSEGGATDTKGTVSFIARYAVQGVPRQIHEDAFFTKEGDTWFYVDGNVHRPEPTRRAIPKVGRNDPCSCGSGKKFKKCCG